MIGMALYPFRSGQECFRSASTPAEISRWFTVGDVFICASALFIHSCPPRRRKEKSGQRYDDMTWIHCKDVCVPAAKFFDGRRRRRRRFQKVDPFHMASASGETSLGYLTEDHFTLRLELRIRSPDNESATFVNRRRMPTRKRTVLCEVSLTKHVLIAEKWIMSVEH